MSDLSEITILKKTNNSCTIRIDSVYNHSGHPYNAEIEYDETLLKATLFYFLVHLAGKIHTDHQNCPLALILGKPEPGVYKKVVFDLSFASSFIAHAKVIDYQYILPDLEDKKTREQYESYLEEGVDETEITGMLSEQYFVSELVFHDANLLNGIEEGMSVSSSYDTFICDWLK